MSTKPGATIASDASSTSSPPAAKSAAELDDEAVARDAGRARVESGGRIDDPAVLDQQGVTGR